MRFPGKFRYFQPGSFQYLRGRRTLILKLGPHGVGDSELLAPVQLIPSLVWIGGAEPLGRPEVPKFANAVAAAGRRVFLQTDGKNFRRHVHEFQPSPQFHLAFHFTGASVDAAENADVVEAIRIAKLSGFLTVGFTIPTALNQLENLFALHSQFKKLDLDGELIFGAGVTPELDRAIADARRSLLDGWWSNLSNLFNTAVLPAAAQSEGQATSQSPSRHPFNQTTGQPAAPDFDLDEGAQA